MTALFGGGERADRSRFEQWESSPDFAFRDRVESGNLEWGAWTAGFHRERGYRKGGGWRDTVRVNLSRPDLACVLAATWPVGVDGSKESLVRLLDELTLRDG